jgi:hypothetical protein
MDLPISIFYSGASSGSALYSDAGCSCGTFGQAPTAFEFANLGGPGEAPTPRNPDLVIGAPGGAFVKYGTELADGPVLTCGQSNRFGELVPVRDVSRGRFACDPDRGRPGCAPYDDVVVVSAKALGGGTFDDPGTIRVIFGGPNDLSTAAGGARLSGVEAELRPLTFLGRSEPKDPRSGEVADFNGDGFDDLAVLYGASSEEVHVWLGAANRGLGEVAEGIILEECANSDIPGTTCTPLRRFATPDLDGDGRAEVVVVCDPSSPSARLRWFSPRVER